jgi:type IV fimbrial biogenesis protein FimT
MRKKHAGFTLLELIITVSIAAILMGLGVPSFINTIRTNRLAGATNEMISTFMYARSEAIKRNAQISVCKSSDGSTCASGSAGWETGWITYVPTNANGNFTAGDTVLNVHEPLNSALSATGNNNLTSRVLFSSLGLAPARMGAIVIVSPSDNTNTRTICIAYSGRARLVPKGSTCSS